MQQAALTYQLMYSTPLNLKRMTVSVTQSLSEFTCVYSEIHANFGTHVYIFCYKIVVPYAVILKENVRVNTRCLIPGKHYKPNANRITKLVVEAHTCY